MAKHKKSHHEEHMDESWLIPYADLLTLLLALFIVMYAASNVDEEKMNAMAIAFGQMMANEFPSGLPNGDTTGVGFPLETVQEIDIDALVQSIAEQNEGGEAPTSLGADDMVELQKTLENYFESAGISSRVTTYIDDRGLVVSLSDVILFKPGSAEINAETVETLKQIGNSVKNFDNYIRVEGHTDTVPINTTKYPSNWELSGARASSVIKIFISQCDIKPERLVSVGYGEFKPVADNDTDEGRGKNRRVDIIVLDVKFNMLEDHFTSENSTDSADDTQNQEQSDNLDAETEAEIQEQAEETQEIDE